jgi:hypothetical protein
MNARPQSLPYCAAILFLNCLSFCVLCNSNLSTAYFNLSFFCTRLLSCRAFAALSPLPPPAILARNAAALAWFCRAAELLLSELDDRRPSCKSHFAFRPCSRRASFSTWLVARERRCAMLGLISSRRERCASRRVGSGRSSKCCLCWFVSWGVRDWDWDGGVVLLVGGRTYARCLEHFAEAGEVVHTFIQGGDGVVEEL